MKILRSLVVLAVLIGIIGGGAYLAMTKLPKDKVAGAASVFSHLKPVADAVIANSGDKIPKNFDVGHILGAYTQLTGGTTSSGTSSAAASGSASARSSVPQKPQLLEQVRYTYCQQVMKDYDERYGGRKN